MTHEVARASSARGEVVLRRRDDGALELRVNGTFVMDDVETSSERGLASLALEQLAGQTGALLVGGLGLGFTVAGLVESPLPSRVLVAEIEPALVGWLREGAVPATAAAIRDPRVDVRIGDVRRVVEELPDACLDAILLDVDNGPDGLVYETNAALYETAFLRRCAAVLRPGGTLLVWSAASSTSLMYRLAACVGLVLHREYDVSLGERDESYHVYVARTAAP